MSLISMLGGKKNNELQLQSILREAIPRKKDFTTISGKEAFSSSYYCHVPYELEESHLSSVIYLGRSLSLPGFCRIILGVWWIFCEVDFAFLDGSERLMSGSLLRKRVR